MNLSGENLRKLQRGVSEDLPPVGEATFTAAPIDVRSMITLAGVGRLDKEPVKRTDKPPRVGTEDLLIGLHGYKLPVAFAITGTPAGVRIELGTWEDQGQGSTSQRSKTEAIGVLRSVLSGLYPAVKFGEPATGGLRRWARGGVALGVPTIRGVDPADGALPIDRLIRGTGGAHWAVLVLAIPETESRIAGVRDATINNLRNVQAEAQSLGVPNTLAQHYLELGQMVLTGLTRGIAVGVWRTAIYLMGDEDSYARLASVWASVYGGEDSILDPVRVRANPEAPRWAPRWAMPDVTRLGPYHPYAYQTMLSSTQLAGYIHLPNLETHGFSIESVPDFDVSVTEKATEARVKVGAVMQRRQRTDAMFEAPIAGLSRHAFVSGVTGSGKTNTIFHLLKQATAAGIPFLVIEPAKTEYRALLNDPNLGPKLKVFTLGNETVAPLRVNPFEVLPGTAPAVHLDLLRSAFSAGFGMWTPLPQILERALHGVYEDAGWDLTSGTNRRLAAGQWHPLSFPTLTELVAKADEVTRALGYEERIASDLRAALSTRLNALRTGGKGRMLDVERSLPIEALLEGPTILELESLGDEDDKALVMALLLVRLVEYRRTGGQKSGLTHLLVIEEAHRLLANQVARRQEEGDARGKAVESFVNLLAEIRAYGQGVIIADQVPVKLAPDVIKNTNLKIAHRIVAEDDRRALAGAMAMNPRQMQSLATLEPGEAAVFREGEDAPVLVRVPYAKADANSAWPSDRQVAERMRSALADPKLSPAYVPNDICRELCGQCDSGVCAAARKAITSVSFQRAFARTVLSIIEAPESLNRLWPDILAVVRAERAATTDLASFLRCVVVQGARALAAKRGRQGGWPYADTEEFGRLLARVLVGKMNGAAHDIVQAYRNFKECALRLHARRDAPYEFCEEVCSHAPICLYRSWVSDIIQRGAYDDEWYGEQDRWNLCKTGAAYTVIEAAEPDWDPEQADAADQASRRVGLCFAQQKLAGDLSYLPGDRRSEMQKLIQISLGEENRNG